MRRAEACAVRWGDLDLVAGTLEVSRSHVAVPGFRDDQSTKTRSTRTVSIDEATVAILVAIKSSRPEPLVEANHYVFTNDGYRPWRPDYASTRWAQLREQAGVDKTVRLHDLRHWQATRLFDAGIPLPTVAARVGHASGATTMKVYAHRTPEADKRASKIVGDILADV